MSDSLKELLKEQSEARVDAKIHTAARALRVDANTLSFLRGQFTELETNIVEVAFQPLRSAQMIPFVGGYDSRSEFIDYEMETSTGVAQNVTKYSKDYPSVSTFLENFRNRVLIGGASYEYNIDDIGGRPGIPSYDQVQRKAKAAAEAIARWHDRLALNGDSASGVTGFANNANVPVVAAITGSWTAATTAQDMYNDLIKLLNSVSEASEGNHRPNRLALPLAAFNLISVARLGTDSTETVMSVLQRNYPELQMVSPWEALKDKGVAGAGRAVAYVADPDAVAYRAVVPYRESNPVENGFCFEIKAQGKGGGTIFYKPLSAAYMDVLAP